MIDTFTIRQVISDELFLYLKKIKFFSYLPRLRKKEEMGDSFPGLAKVSYKDCKNLNGNIYLDITIKAENLNKYKDNNKLSIYNTEYYKPLISTFNQAIERYYLLCDLNTLKDIPTPEDIKKILSFDNYYFKRVDYCFQFEDCIDQKQYIKLFHLGDMQQQGNPNFDYYKENEELPEGSFYAYGNGYRINYYNKHNQLINKKATQEEIDQAKNCMRLEIQCDLKKIDKIKKDYKKEVTKGISKLYKDDNSVTAQELKNMQNYELENIPSDIEILFSVSVAKKIILNTYTTICRKGDYYKKKKVEKIIKDSANKSRMPKMLELLNLVNPGNGKKRAIRDIRELIKKNKIKTNIKPDEVTDILKDFDKLNINVVCLEENYKYDSLPNLCNEIEDYFFHF